MSSVPEPCPVVKPCSGLRMAENGGSGVLSDERGLSPAVLAAGSLCITPACMEAVVIASPCAQIPYTVAKFVVFEHVARGLRAHAAGAAPPWPSSVDLPSAHLASEVHLAALSPFAATAVNLGAGLVAGCVAALVSQPADTLLSRINRAKAAPGALVGVRKPACSLAAALYLPCLADDWRRSYTVG